MSELVEPVLFSEWLKYRRKYLDLTQAELAGRAGCSPAGLRKIETGERRPSKELAALLAAALEVPPEMRATFVRVARGELNLERLGPPSPSEPVREESPFASRLSIPPLSPTPFIGRDDELNALSELLRDAHCRLLTLIGPGGIGKTRLGIQVAASMAERYMPVCFVSLAQVSSSALIVPAIADALGFTFQGQIDQRLQLLNYMKDKHFILFLDNAEHLLDGFDIISETIACAPHVKFLVTSRERLNLQGEWVYEIGGLPVPPEGDDAIEGYSSVALFIQSARRARAGFVLRPDDRPAVIRICRLLEGTPLGIELAAAWTFTLSPVDIAQQIEQNFDFLESTRRDVPERQRSLRAAFDHSWGLLTEEERLILARLSIFQGGFELEAAQRVAGASAATLLALASKSLVRHQESGRYDLHEVIRQYAFGYMNDDPEMDDTHDRHSDYYLMLLKSHERDLKGPAQCVALRRLTDEIGNIRAAWAWAVTRENFAVIASALRSYGWMCEVGGRLQEGIAELGLVEWALRDHPLDSEYGPILGQALAQQGLINFRLGRFEQAMAQFDESLALARPTGNPALLVDALVLSAIMLHLCGDYEGSQERMREGAASASSADDLWFHVYAHYNLGYVAALTGREEEGYELMRHSLAAWREKGDPRSISLGLNFLAPTAVRLGQFEQARAWLEESVALATELGDRWGLGTAYRQLGLVALSEGYIDEAKTHLNQSLAIYQGYVTGYDLVHTNLYLGECAAAEGEDDAAAKIIGSVIDDALGIQLDALAVQGMADLAEVRYRQGRFGEAYALAMASGRHRAATHEIKLRAKAIAQRAVGCLSAAERVAVEERIHGRSLAAVAGEFCGG